VKSIIFNVYIITMGDSETLTLVRSNVCLVQRPTLLFITTIQGYLHLYIDWCDGWSAVCQIIKLYVGWIWIKTYHKHQSWLLQSIY